MTVLAQDRIPFRVGNEAIPEFSSTGGTAATKPNIMGIAPMGSSVQRNSGYPVADNVLIYQGALVGLDASGNAIPASATAKRIVGIAQQRVDNTVTGHAAGALTIMPMLGVYGMNQTGTTITKAYFGATVYAADDNTVSLSSSLGTLPVAGTVVDVDSTTGLVMVQILGPNIPQPSSAQLQQQITYNMPADAAASTTTAEMTIGTIPVGATISAINIQPTGAVTASDTVYATITVAQGNGAGGARSTLASVTTKTSGGGGTGNWVAFTGVSMGTITNGAVTANSIFTLTIAKASTGTQLPTATIQIVYTLA